VYARLGAEPLVYFFVRENLVRFAGDAYDVGRPAWFYLPAYAAEGLPWSPFLPLALWRLLRGNEVDRSIRRSSRFLAIWVALVVALLSLSRGKIDYYLLPLYPALSLLVARLFIAVPWRRLERAWSRVVLLLFVGGVTLFALRPPRVPEPWLPGEGAQTAFVVVLGVSAVAALAAAARPGPRAVLAALAGGLAGAWLVLAALFLPAFVRAQPNDVIVRDVAREHRFRPDLTLVTCSDPARARRDILFDVRLTAEERCDLWPLAASSRPYLFLVRPRVDESFRVIPTYRHVATYRYLPARALTLGGLFSLQQPGAIVLGANFETDDPVAGRKRRKEYRQMLKRERAELRRQRLEQRSNQP
jgi:hypothetical protein